MPATVWGAKRTSGFLLHQPVAELLPAFSNDFGAGEISEQFGDLEVRLLRAPREWRHVGVSMDPNDELSHFLRYRAILEWWRATVTGFDSHGYQAAQNDGRPRADGSLVGGFMIAGGRSKQPP